MSKQLTIRRVPEEVGRRLDTIAREKGKSVNTLVLEILKAAMGVDERKRRLSRYATWTEEDLREFQQALTEQRIIDDELWR